MAFAITQPCCSDASCVSVCPVNCIHPTPGEPDFGLTETLYVDPRTCIDCGACADACPVDALVPVSQLRGADVAYAEANRRYFLPLQAIAPDPAPPGWDAPRYPRSLPASVGPLRIAIVGTGPAACYTAQALLQTTGAHLTMLERLPVPGGLARFGVAPDHPATRRVGETFARLFDHPRVRLHTGVEVGRHLSHGEVAAAHSAVVYAVGAPDSRPLGIPGEHLPGSVAATDLVAWYNGAPPVPPQTLAQPAPDLSGERGVIVGAGNVALDVARILLADPDALARTQIAPAALEALRAGRVHEIVLLCRRGPAQAAFSTPELRALLGLPGLDVVVEDTSDVRAALADAAPGSRAALLDDARLGHVDTTLPPAPGRRLVLRFATSPVEVLGSRRVRGVRALRDGQRDDISTGLLVRAVGSRGRPVAALPFDDVTGTVPSERGRVTDPVTGAGLPGSYVVGWVKRGPHGGIGANRVDADETVATLLADAAARLLPARPGSGRSFDRLVRRRAPYHPGVSPAARGSGRR